MTEDEAKTKWCPFARNAGVTTRETGAAVSVNRDGREHYGTENVNCIGSACMAWRRSGAKFKDGRTGQLLDFDLTGHGTWIDVGYCGLAGAPQ